MHLRTRACCTRFSESEREPSSLVIFLLLLFVFLLPFVILFSQSLDRANFLESPFYRFVSLFFPSCRQYRFSSDSFNPRARDIARTWNTDTRRWELQVEVEGCDERTRWTSALRGCRKKQLIWDVWCFELEFCYLFRFGRANQGS